MKCLDSILAGLLVLSLLGCSDDDSPDGDYSDTDTDTDSDGDSDSDADDECAEDPEELGISDLPDGFENYKAEGFVKYTEVVAPNGKPIRIFAQDEVSDLAVVRARNLLTFFLEDYPGSQWGDEKAEVANCMADNNAVLAMPNGAHSESNEPNVPAQPLYEEETPVTGSPWYMNNDYEYRDAAFEEIFHLVHDTGIGTYVPGALPEYQAQLLAEAREAIKDGRWGIPIDPGVEEWLEELEAEGSLAQEYIASVIDSYYGLWGPWDETEGGMWGIYIAKTREEIENMDPDGMALLEAFLPPYLTYEALLDGDLDETFSMTFDLKKPYTHKSRYLMNARLTGCNNSGLKGNDRDNRLQGNRGDNSIDGMEGDDTAVFKGAYKEYTVSTVNSTTTVVDSVELRDGTDTLVNVESLEFSDQTIKVPQ